MNRIPLVLAAIPLLLVARLLPAEGLGLAFRLAAASVCLLIPGALLARALRLPAVAEAAALSLGVLFLGLVASFVLGTSILLALVVMGAVALAALPFAFRVDAVQLHWATWIVVGAGAAFGAFIWRFGPALGGDALFHLARVRKLETFHELSIKAVGEFADGGPHPGYAFPLWHGFLALVAKLAGVDPTDVVLNEAAILVPLAFVLAFEAGRALFDSIWGGVAVLAGQAAITGLAPGDGGAYDSLALPATAARQLLVPMVLASLFLFIRQRRPLFGLPVGAASLAIALAHPTYALFLLIPLTGFALVRLVWARRDFLPLTGVLAAVALPTAAVFLWLRPIVEDTAGHTPAREELRRALERYARELDVDSLDRYSLAPEVFSRSGAVAVAALVVIPLAALAARSRWAAFVVGGSLPILALTLADFLFPAFADLVSLSQARRIVGFLPLAFAFAGGCAVLAGLLRGAALPVALAAGLWLHFTWPGDFGELHHGGPAFATWVALVGSVVAIPVGFFAERRWGSIERRGYFAGLAAVLFVLPVAVHGMREWREPPGPRVPLTPGLVEALRELPEGGIVFSDLETSYRIAALAPVYVAAGPPAHVADTEDNRPYARRRDVVRFLRTGDLAIPRRYGARWLVIDRERSLLRPALPVLHADDRYLLYRL
ncbi:MAG: hypothetical protein M3P42_05845 [Actinomycetota bacterium]|nr:hypothetical protein [Actinomycetota bacterium]